MCLCVCRCVKAAENLSFYISGITQPIELNCASKAEAIFL